VSVAEGGWGALPGLFHHHLWAMMSWYVLAFVWGLELLWVTVLGHVDDPARRIGLLVSLPLNLIWSRAILREPGRGAEYLGVALVVMALASEAIRDEKRPPTPGTSPRQRVDLAGMAIGGLPGRYI
jgi:hypothetical protein